MALNDGTIISSAFGAGSLDLSLGTHGIGRQNNLKIGTVIAVRYIDSTNGIQMSQSRNSKGKDGFAYETVYDVKIEEMMYKSFIFPGCRVLKPFFGPNNYFEVIHESADISPTYAERRLLAENASSLAGARCILAFLEGEASAPIILGFLNHPARKSKITEDKGIHLGFEFNGINVTIDKDGAFKLIASGPLLPPTSIPAVPLPEIDIRQDPINGPLTIAIDSSFNFELTDVVGQTISLTHGTPVTGSILIGNGDDSISIDLSPLGGTISITSSKSLSEECEDYVLSAGVSADITTKALTINADVSTEITTGNFKLDSSIAAEFKAKQIKIDSMTTFALKTTTMSFKGASGELLAILDEIFTALGTCIIASPVGPCSAIQASPQWAAQIQLALVKLKSLMG